MAVTGRIKRAWNAFRNVQASVAAEPPRDLGPSTSRNPSRPRTFAFNQKTIIASIYTRLSIDVAGVDFRHVKVDNQGRYLEDVNSSLNDCLRLKPNLDQGPRQWRQDIVSTILDDGVAAIVPIDTTFDPTTGELLDIFNLRVGKIVKWYPQHVRVSLWNEEKGLREEVTLEKSGVGLVENPLYGVMNEPNGTLQRLLRKLALLDVVDEQSASGKLDIIIQLPYTIKTEARRAQAESRRADIEFQLKGSQYGIAYTDGTEKITQLNRPTENNLMKQVEYLTTMLYGQLGLTEDVMNGTADETVMNAYYFRTVKPLVDAIVEACRTSLLGMVKLKAGESIHYFRNPFQFIPISAVAEIADKFTRNEILTANEIRQAIGFVPSSDPKADQLVNSNMPQSTDPASDTFAKGLSK